MHETVTPDHPEQIDDGRDSLMELNKKCRACTDLSTWGLDYLLRDSGNDSEPRTVEHHHSLLDLRQSAEAGCQSCSMFLDAVATWNYRARDISLDEWVNRIDRKCHSYRFKAMVGWTVVTTDAGLLRTADKVIYYRHQASDFEYDEDGQATGSWLASSPCKAVFHADRELWSHEHGHYPIARRPILPEVDWSIPKAWVQRCLESHNACRSVAQAKLPTRILDVSGDHDLRLVESANMFGSYLTLSHRWGDMIPISTTKATLEKHCREIAFASLPRTFRDAITATRRLGYRYLWIDSLCIIQDDDGDWQQQCAQMRHIYSNSVLTIVGPGAANAYDGFLDPRQSMPGNSVTLHVEFREPNRTSTSVELCVAPLFPATDAGDDVDARRRRHGDKDHLHDRGWYMQERLLSPRLLQFGSTQMVFECDSMQVFEEYRLPLVAAGYLNGLAKNCLYKRRLESRGRSWCRIVEAYTYCYLSQGDDVLPALSGIADVFSNKAADIYLAGLWKSDLVRGLCWARDRLPGEANGGLRRAAASRHLTPTWSWAACRYPVRFEAYDMDHHGEEQSLQSQLVVLGTTVIAAGEDPYGQTQGGGLHLRGKLHHCYFRYRRCPTMLLQEIHETAGMPLFSNTLAARDTAVAGCEVRLFSVATMLTLDIHGSVESASRRIKEKGGLEEVWCLHIDDCVALVLRAIPGRDRTFERIGLLQSYDPTINEWASEASVADVHLI
ncbi:hypothetical protein LTR17_021903 [Elasticomyces elasticus]|nr:hypothetical protein LTR17_021903 [Elasticomyces elasticus]